MFEDNREIFEIASDDDILGFWEEGRETMDLCVRDCEGRHDVVYFTL